MANGGIFKPSPLIGELSFALPGGQAALPPIHPLELSRLKGPLRVPSRRATQLPVRAMKDKWVNIRYRDFYDIPRIFVFRLKNRVYLADCPFDDELDEYHNAYELFELPEDVVEALDGSWKALRKHSIQKMGRVNVSDMIFDVTKRKQVNLASFKGKL